MADKVDVYFNLHKKVWSIRSRRTGRVIGHSRVVTFDSGACMGVGKSGRAKVLATGQKNVHAFIRGAQPSYEAGDITNAVRVSYNPHKADHFVRKDNGERIDSASRVVMIARENAAPEVWAFQ